jgi:hypothetical protein
MDPRLSDEERARAAAVETFVVWYEDRFAFGADRDPAFPVGYFLARADAEAEAQRRGGRSAPAAGKFDGYEVTGHGTLLEAHEAGFFTAAEVRRALGEHR